MANELSFLGGTFLMVDDKPRRELAAAEHQIVVSFRIGNFLKPGYRVIPLTVRQLRPGLEEALEFAIVKPCGCKYFVTRRLGIFPVYCEGWEQTTVCPQWVMNERLFRRRLGQTHGVGIFAGVIT